jgi:hypothetical protein
VGQAIAAPVETMIVPLMLPAIAIPARLIFEQVGIKRALSAKRWDNQHRLSPSVQGGHMSAWF